METVAIIVAGGRGIRFGGETPKQFRSINNRPLLSWTVELFEKAKCITDIVIVVPQDFLLYTNQHVVEPYGFNKVRKVVVGGESRPLSVLAGLKALSISTKYVAIHDGARPITDLADIERVVSGAKENRAAILAKPSTDSVKRVEREFILATLDRTKIYLAETPQVFQYDLIMSAFDKLDGFDSITDDASLIEKIGFKIKTVIPDYPNIKVTTEADMIFVRSYINEH